MIAKASNTFKVELNWPIRSIHDLPELKDIDAIVFLEIYLGPKVVFNSSGIRDWIRWLAPASTQANLTIQLYECPESFIQLVNMISDFIPKNSEIISFYVPFYSEHTRETKRALLTRGHDFFEEKYSLPEMKDKNGNLMEIDVDNGKFFRFLKPKQ
jgi:hypothetical protein